MGSILREWVTKLGLRHQGTLLAVVRGCDTIEKHDPAKDLTRCYRAAILCAHCGDVKRAASFIEAVTFDELHRRMGVFVKSHDHYPLHYVMHLLHASEIVGYKGPRLNADGSADAITHAEAWVWFYHRMVRKLHFNAETEAELDRRLNADEETFARND